MSEYSVKDKELIDKINESIINDIELGIPATSVRNINFPHSKDVIEFLQKKKDDEIMSLKDLNMKFENKGSEPR